MKSWHYGLLACAFGLGLGFALNYFNVFGG